MSYVESQRAAVVESSSRMHEEQFFLPARRYASAGIMPWFHVQMLHAARWNNNCALILTPCRNYTIIAACCMQQLHVNHGIMAAVSVRKRLHGWGSFWRARFSRLVLCCISCKLGLTPKTPFGSLPKLCGLTKPSYIISYLIYLLKNKP